MADVATSPTHEDEHKRAQKPDEAKYKADLAEAEKAHKAAQDRFNAARAKIDNVRGPKGSASTPGNDRFKELIEDQKSIRQQQSVHKNAKSGQQEKFSQNDAAIKKLIQDQKDIRGRSSFKSLDELNHRIDTLQKQVDAGNMKLVDEKKNLKDITEMTRQKKTFSQLADLQRQIDEKKAESAELRKTFDNPEARALSQKYEDNQKELDDIKAQREAGSKNIDTLKADRDRLYNEQQATYAAIRKVKDDYFAARKAWKEHEDQIYQARRDRQRAEREAEAKERRNKIAQHKLEEAQEPAFAEEMRTAESLIKHFDPTYGAKEGDKGPGEFAATAQRTVGDDGFKGMRVIKKDEENFFVGSGGKKKGKGKKGPATNGASAESGAKMQLNSGIFEQLNLVGVDPPATKDEVPEVVKKLKEKLEKWKKDSPTETQKNIDKAKDEIARLNAEADAAAEAPPPARASGRGGRQDKAKKVAQKDAGANVEITGEAEQDQEKDAVKDVAEELKATKIEDALAEEGGATA